MPTAFPFYFEQEGCVYLTGDMTRPGLSGGGLFRKANNLEFAGIHRARFDESLELCAVSSRHIREQLRDSDYEPVPYDSVRKLEAEPPAPLEGGEKINEEIVGPGGKVPAGGGPPQVPGSTPLPPDLAAMVERSDAGLREQLNRKLPKKFYGRRWLFEEIRRLGEQQSPPHLLIEGGPGVGKSAIVAHLAHRGGWPSPFETLETR